MAIAEQEITQEFVVRLTQEQAAKLRQAASANGQSVEEFVLSASLRAVEDALSPAFPVPLPAGRDPLDSIIGIFKDEPLMDALMERIHEEQQRGIEQFRLEAEAEEAEAQG